MTLALHGIGVSRGIAVSRALVWDSAFQDVPRNRIDKKSVKFEVKRFDIAVKRVSQELEDLRKQLTADSPAEFDALLNLHNLILQDPTLSEMPKTLIADDLERGVLVEAAPHAWCIEMEIKLYRDKATLSQAGEAFWKANLG